MLGPSPPSPREDRKRAVPAVTSKAAPLEPSCLVKIHGPLVALSGVRYLSTLYGYAKQDDGVKHALVNLTELYVRIAAN